MFISNQLGGKVRKRVLIFKMIILVFLFGLSFASCNGNSNEYIDDSLNDVWDQLEGDTWAKGSDNSWMSISFGTTFTGRRFVIVRTHFTSVGVDVYSFSSNYVAGDTNRAPGPDIGGGSVVGSDPPVFQRISFNFSISGDRLTITNATTGSESLANMMNGVYTPIPPGWN